MTYFIFAGDMLVMAFMIALVVWVSLKSSNEVLEESAAIPLHDEEFVDPPERNSTEGDAHG